MGDEAYRRLQERLQAVEAENRALRAQLDDRQRTGSEARLRAVLESIPDEVWFTDATGEIVLVNDIAIHNLGFASCDEFCRNSGEAIAQLAIFSPDGTPRPPEDAPLMRALHGEVIRSEQELVRTPATGEFRAREVSSGPVRDAAGQIIGAVAVVRDVTERRQAEEALRRSEARWTAAIENFDIGVIIATEDEQVIYWNPAARAMHGFTSAREGLGALERTPITFQLWTPDGTHLLELDEWPMRRIKRGEPVRNLELRLRRPDQGWEKIVSYSGNMVETASGERLIFLSVYDLTEQRRAEEALRESEERLQLFIENAPVALAMFDTSMRYLVASRRWMTDYGLDERDLRGLSHYEVSPEIPDSWRSVHQRALAGEVLHAREDRFERLDGAVQWLRWEVLPWRKADGSIGGTIIFTEDITERKRTEEALRKSEAQLISIVENLSEGVIASTTDGFVFQWNRAGLAMFGFSTLAEAQRMLPEFLKLFEVRTLDGEVVPFEQWPLSRVLRGELLREWDVCMRRLDTGVETIFSYSGSLVYNENGQPLMAVLTVTDITGRKQTEEALRESEERLWAIFRTLPVGILITDRHGRVVESNGVVERIYGGAVTLTQSPQEYRVGKTWWADTGRPVQAGEWPSDMALRTGEAELNREIDLLRADGTCGTVLDSAAPLRDAEGQIIGAVVAIQEITDRKQAEQALRESEARFSALANNIPQLTWMADGTGWIFWYNRRWYEYTGTTPEQMEGWGWQRVHDPDVLPRVLDEWQRSIATGEPFDMEFPLRGADGRFRPFLTRVFPVKDAAGRVEYWFGTNTDISEIRQAQDELVELNRTLEQRVHERTEQLQQTLTEAESARSRFQGLLESAPDGIVIVNAAGQITLVNSQLERLSGYTRDDLLDKPVELLVPENFRTLHIRQREEYMAAPRTRPMGVGMELYLLRKDGEQVPVEISLSPFRTPNATLVIASIRDITARKAAEAEIKRLNTALQRNVEQLTAANKELEAFSYSVSHDLRAPLRSVDGFTRILAERYPDRLDEQGRDYLARARAAAQRMNRLIEDMLNLSRIGRREMRWEPVNLSAMAASVVEELRQRDPERQVAVEIQPDLQVHGDAGLLRIVLDNLLGNAWKFTGHREDARIAVGMMVQDHERVYFVRDNGAGFDMAYVNKLFTPFQRLHTEEEFPGTGIGLAIVQRVVTRHGGRVWAEGEEGKGATIYFTLGEAAADA